MARRAHLRELGCIASDDLSEIGAGKEGWLDAGDVLAALDIAAVALANRSVVLLLPLDDSAPAVKVRPSLSPLDGHISAVEWLAFDGLRVVAIGTSNGYLLLYSVHAKLIHKQLIHPSRISRLKAYGMNNGFAQETSSDEVCIVMPGVIAKIEGPDIQSLLQRWLQDSDSHYWGKISDKKVLEDDDCPYGRLQFQLWNIGKYGPCVDAAISGIMPPPLLEFQSTERYYSAVAVGADAVISAFRLSVDKNRSLVGAILSRVVPAAYSTIASFTNIIWRSSQSPPKKPEASQPFARASPLTCLKDNPRKGEKLTLSPSGSLAAITDSLGRVLLLDTQALVVVRQWKGYRDASCLFMEMLVQNDGASTSTSSSHKRSKNDYCLCLAIHAPRKGIVEIWKMRTGPRVLTVQCPKGSRILQPAYRFGSLSSESSSYSPLEVYILNGDSGQISVLNQSLS